MAITAGIFGNGTNLKERYVPDHAKLKKLVKIWKNMGLKIVLTSGTYDLFHIGHAQYLEKAKELGDLLIVGVDSDERVRSRKGPNRPVVPEEERIGILSHVRHVDVITIKNHKDPKGHLIKLVCPDILVVSKSTGHKEKDVEQKQKYCGKIVVLEPQSSTSTSAKVRLLHVSGADEYAKKLTPMLSELVEKELIAGSQALAQNIAAQIPTVMEDALRALDKKDKRK